MSEVEYIVGVYNNFNPSPEIEDQVGYYFLYLLDHKGMLDIDEAKKTYLEKFNLKTEPVAFRKNLIGPFESIDQLNQYAFTLCENLNASKISLLSVVDYNQLLETSQSSLELHRDMLEKGNVIENIDRNKKKGILSKIFG